MKYRLVGSYLFSTLYKFRLADSRAFVIIILFQRGLLSICNEMLPTTTDVCHYVSFFMKSLEINCLSKIPLSCPQVTAFFYFIFLYLFIWFHLPFFSHSRILSKGKIIFLVAGLFLICLTFVHNLITSDEQVLIHFCFHQSAI